MTVAFPYRTTSPERIALEHWRLVRDENTEEKVTDHIAGWDYHLDLELRRSAAIDSPGVARDVGLDGLTSGFLLQIVALTGPASSRRVALSRRIPANETWEEELVVSLDSTTLADSLTLVTELVLPETIEHSLSFVPSMAGSRLYSVRETLDLERSPGRFPMELVDFERSLSELRASRSMWYLDWDPSRPESRLLGTVVLYINSANAAFTERILSQDAATTAALRCDVIRTMCEHLLRNRDFQEDYDLYEPDTVGGQVREWLIAAFGSTGLGIVRQMMESSPGRFEARIQDTFC